MTANAGELHATGLPRGALQPSGAVQRPSVGRSPQSSSPLTYPIRRDRRLATHWVSRAR
jgi:hypothetical protein